MLQDPENFMERALFLAEKGRGSVEPNPLVGAVLVKSGRVISEGYHARYGGPHAEVVAIKKAGRRARGSTLYVSLEPCCTFGKTPPCTNLILESKVKRVVAATLDPNPKHAGRGFAALRKAGIKTEAGLLREKARLQNEVFFKWVKTGRPFVTLKMAQSLDGKISTAKGQSRWITGPAARNLVHQLRAFHQAVLVGSGTARADNPRLNVNISGARQPLRIILDKNLSLPPSSNVFKAGDGLTLVATSVGNFKKRFDQFKRRGLGLLGVSLNGKGLDLKDLLAKIGSMGISSLLVEGGGETAASFIADGLADKIYFFTAPKIIGGRASTTSVEGSGAASLEESVPVTRLSASRVGDDFLFCGYPEYKK